MKNLAEYRKQTKTTHDRVQAWCKEELAKQALLAEIGYTVEDKPGIKRWCFKLNDSMKNINEK